MKKITFLLFLFISFFTLYSQNPKLIALTIPQELKEDANAVVRENFTTVTIADVDEMIVNNKRTITILNKLGNREVDTYAHYDNDTKITRLSVRVYNAFGKEIKKYSKNKFTDVSAVDGGTLYSDSRVKYIDYTPIAYPYTVVFESEYKTSSTGFIPKWYPVESFYLAVEHSEYKVNNPKNLSIRNKEKNFSAYSIEKLSEDILHYKMENQKAIKSENHSPDFIDLMPSLLVALDNFTLKKVSGYAKDWSEFGKWMERKLLKDRNVLDPLTEQKIKSLVVGVEDDIEKAKILYKYMQNKTRYISVQVGIGGWEPIPANEIDKMGYGDCKGLTNYMKAIFDVAGIESNYTVVYAKNRRDIDEEFSSIQGNHVILNLPNNGNDIWLECTSQTMPFGFLGDFTDDRNVLVITSEGGVIKRTPSYKNESNLQSTKADVTLLKDGSLEAEITITSKDIQYDNRFHIADKNKEELDKYYKSNYWDYLNNLEIKSTEINNNKDSVSIEEKTKVSVLDYASISDTEYLFKVNSFNRNSFVPKRHRNRKLPLKISRGYKDVDEFTYKIPEGYSISLLPENKTIDSKFGKYKVEFEKIDENSFKYRKELLIKEGLYAKEDYKLYRKFRKSIARQENLRIALLKK